MNLKYGFSPCVNDTKHAWVDQPILDHGVKWYPVKRYTWFPHSAIFDYCESRQSAEEICEAINRMKPE